MPILYEQTFQPAYKRLRKPRFFQATRKTYRIEFPSTIGEGECIGRGTIKWNPAYTKILDAYLRATGITILGGATPLTPVRGNVAFVVNAYVDGEQLTDICVIGSCQYPFSINYPITTLIQNGENEVKIIVRKSWGWPTGISVTGLSVYIDVDFEGEPPEVEIKPPPPEWWGYVKWGMIGVGAIAGTFAVLKAIEIARKPKG